MDLNKLSKDLKNKSKKIKKRIDLEKEQSKLEKIGNINTKVLENNLNNIIDVLSNLTTIDFNDPISLKKAKNKLNKSKKNALKIDGQLKKTFKDFLPKEDLDSED